MEPNLPATHEVTAVAPDRTSELPGDHLDSQRQVVQQNWRVALLPLAIIAFTLIAFVAAAWTFLTALPTT